jgi:hypothetical protein
MLGLFLFSEITASYEGMSVNKISLYKEAAQIGAFKSFNITFDAVDFNNVYPLFGKQHKTYIICSSEITKDEIIAYLSTNDIQIGEAKYLYKADLNSFSWRRVNTKV